MLINMIFFHRLYCPLNSYSPPQVRHASCFKKIIQSWPHGAETEPILQLTQPPALTYPLLLPAQPKGAASSAAAVKELKM